ncbi:hypothetical protein V6N13_004550 [Hibiscus sabdariffa]
MGLTSFDDAQCTEVMAPVAHSNRSPVLLLMGVVIEADAFKESDVIYRALSSKGHADMVQTAQLVRIIFSASSRILTLEPKVRTARTEPEISGTQLEEEIWLSVKAMNPAQSFRTP